MINEKADSHKEPAFLYHEVYLMQVRLYEFQFVYYTNKKARTYEVRVFCYPIYLFNCL